MEIAPENIYHANELLVSQLYEHFKDQMSLKILVGLDKIGRHIKSAEITRPGLAFSGFFDIFTYDRVQLVGNTETGYLKTLDEKTRHERMELILSHEVPCFLITNNNELPPDFMEACDKAGVPVLQTPLPSTLTASRLI
ncbi:MAG: hypothetical protein PHX74_06560, partial [Candidatus Sumerlaeales bacterium]|nr:hypothetical protein [Candidatus Sumerlaeales bacterium]